MYQLSVLFVNTSRLFFVTLKKFNKSFWNGFQRR